MSPRPSSRLVRAIAAERADLERERGRVLVRVDDLREELERLEDGLAAIDERAALLERLDRLDAPEPAARPRRSAGPGARSATAPAEAEAGTGARPATPPAEAEAGPRARSATPPAGATAGPDAGPAPPHAEAVAGTSPRARRGRSTSPTAPRDAPLGRRGVLRGTAIREEAARILARRPDAVEGLHYLDWLELLHEAGWAVAGKDPRAVFLTQVSRSPLVRRTTRAGVYALDTEAGARLQRELRERQDELAAVAAARGEGPVLRRRREELTVSIGRVERALEEVVRVLGPIGDATPRARRLAVAG